jgi:transposase-like protein
MLGPSASRATEIALARQVCCRLSVRTPLSDGAGRVRSPLMRMISRVNRASLQLLLGQDLSMVEIGRRFGIHESTVSYWIARHGLRAAHATRHSAKGPIEREQLRALVESGRTIGEIAGAVERSKSTVRHWLARYELRTHSRPGKRPSERSVAAKHNGLVTAQMRCPRHGETAFWLEGRGYYRCKRCRAEAVTRRRRKVKAVLVGEAGGCCCVCGYSRRHARTSLPPPGSRRETADDQRASRIASAQHTAR